MRKRKIITREELRKQVVYLSFKDFHRIWKVQNKKVYYCDMNNHSWILDEDFHTVDEIQSLGWTIYSLVTLKKYYNLLLKNES